MEQGSEGVATWRGEEPAELRDGSPRTQRGSRSHQDRRGGKGRELGKNCCSPRYTRGKRGSWFSASSTRRTISVDTCPWDQSPNKALHRDGGQSRASGAPHRMAPSDIADRGGTRGPAQAIAELPRRSRYPLGRRRVLSLWLLGRNDEENRVIDGELVILPPTEISTVLGRRIDPQRNSI